MGSRKVLESIVGLKLDLSNLGISDGSKSFEAILNLLSNEIRISVLEYVQKKKLFF